MGTGLDFTTLPRVRGACGFAEDDLTEDHRLQGLIATVSAEMEAELRRFAKTREHTETLPHWPASKIMSLRGFPVLDTPEPVVKVANDRNFTDSPTILTRGVDYILENDTGVLRFLMTFSGWRASSGYVVGPTYIQVVYTGGLGATTAAFMDAYPELASAADLQIAYGFKRRDSPGGNLVTGPNSTNYEKPYGWLPNVERVLALHKRRGIY